MKKTGVAATQEFFYRVAGDPSKLRGTCRECISTGQRGRNRSNRERDAQAVNIRQMEHRKKTKERYYLWLIAYFREHPCVDCEEADPLVLDFDHIDPSTKIDSVSSMINKGRTWDVIEAEVEKCEVRCSNCHRRKTAKERNYLLFSLLNTAA